MFNLTLVRNENGDDEMHVTGCADVARTAARRKAWHGMDVKAEYAGETLVAAIEAADKDMADWFGEDPYTESSRENGCWATASVKWAPCFAALMKKEHVVLNSEDGTYRPIVKETKVKKLDAAKINTIAKVALDNFAESVHGKGGHTAPVDGCPKCKPVKVNKAQQVRDALDRGATLVEISNDGDLGVTYAYAWDIKRAYEIKKFADVQEQETGVRPTKAVVLVLMDQMADSAQQRKM